MKKMNVIYVAAITTLLVAFNNCGQFEANSDKKSTASSFSSSGGCNPISTFSPICTPHSPSQLGTNRSLTFQIDTSKINTENYKYLSQAQYDWDHQLNNGATSCSVRTEINGDITHIDCPEAGQLIIDVVITIPTSNDDEDESEQVRYIVQVEILEDAAPLNPIAEEDDDFDGGFDGFPGFGDDTPKNLSGAELYQINCQGCHGILNSSTKRGRSANQIKNAIIGNVGGMGSLSGLSDSELQAIADALDI